MTLIQYKVGDSYGEKLITKQIGKNFLLECIKYKKETILQLSNLKANSNLRCYICRQVTLDNIAVGQRFGRRIVQQIINKSHILLKCDCGKDVRSNVYDLIENKTLRCRHCLDKPIKHPFKNISWFSFKDKIPRQYEYIVIWDPQLKEQFPLGIFKGYKFNDIYLIDERFRNCMWRRIKPPMEII